MSFSNTSAWNDIHDFIFNPDYESKAIVRSNVLAPSISASFYIIITYIGPHFMRNRKPYKITEIMVTYNIIMVILNFYVLLGFVLESRGNFIESICPPDPQYQYLKVIAVLKPYAWLFVLLKYAEFLDSIFFVMRKRFDLLTVLHRVHHTIMPLASVISLRNSPSLSICAYFALFFNCSIHVVMYFYYALAACGPKFRKYLWWKKYLTVLQMIQFGTNILCICMNSLLGCYPTETSEISTLCLSVLFLVLFLNYFIRQIVKIPDTTEEKIKSI